MFALFLPIVQLCIVGFTLPYVVWHHHTRMHFVHPTRDLFSAYSKFRKVRRAINLKKKRVLKEMLETLGQTLICNICLRLLGHLYGKFIEIIGLKAPGNYSASSWSYNLSILFCEGPKPNISMNFGFLDPGNPYLWI